jgi:hypothetical protein
MTCRQVERAIAGSPISDLSPEVLGGLQMHAAGCPACAALLQREALADALLSAHVPPSLVLKTAEEPEGIPVETAKRLAEGRNARKRGTTWGPGPRWLAYAAASLMLVGVGEEIGRRKSTASAAERGVLSSVVTPALADHIPPELMLHGVEDSGFESGTIVREGFNDLKDGRWHTRPSPHTAIIDRRVAHSGRSSLKLFQREYGGHVERHFDLPLPPGTKIRYAVWAKSPSGGSVNNKYFTAGLNVNGVGNLQATVIQASPEWKEIMYEFGTEHFAAGFGVAFSTSFGDGRYKGWDVATWVDDFSLSVLLNGRATYSLDKGDRLTVRLVLPAPYRIEDVDRDSITWTDESDDRHPPVRPVSVEPVNGAIEATFEDHEAAEILRLGAPNGQDPSNANIWGRVRYGKFSVPFFAGFYGPRVAR